MFAAPDYKALYFELFRASEEAANLLREAQLRAEQQVMEAEPVSLRLCPDTKKAGNGEKPLTRPENEPEDPEVNPS